MYIFFKRLAFINIFIAVFLSAENSDITCPTFFYSPNGESLLSLEEAIAITLNNQREIQISEMKIVQQTGVIQESAGPFDPILESGIDYTISEDRQYFPDGSKQIGGRMKP